ncbi:hypothetical protein SCHPADRAFT_762100 [Schizopora paradoxa]|uniref:Uncharacterized protein n=1 Tax=Schizopora paradoxa TaxID=27342 RepID=A0A0H2QXK6_9AGAM|nr:hypothetical protein SCHPADRAFT_762100 [Schizopora paradoxa]
MLLSPSSSLHHSSLHELVLVTPTACDASAHVSPAGTQSTMLSTYQEVESRYDVLNISLHSSEDSLRELRVILQARLLWRPLAFHVTHNVSIAFWYCNR